MGLNAVLVVQLCDESVQDGEIERVASIARSHNAIFQHIPLTHDRVPHLVAVCSRQLFDLVYICGHGIADEADDQVKSVGGEVNGEGIALTLPTLAGLLCENLTKNATVILSCCDAGHEQIATDMMTVCGSMNWVFGVPQISNPDQLEAAFTPLLFQLAHHADPGAARSIAEQAGRVAYSPDSELRGFTLRLFRRQDPDIEVADGVEVVTTDQLEKSLQSLEERYASYDYLRFDIGDYDVHGDGQPVPAEIDHLGDINPTD